MLDKNPLAFPYSVLTIAGTKGFASTYLILASILPKAAFEFKLIIYLRRIICQYIIIVRIEDHPMNHTAIR